MRHRLPVILAGVGLLLGGSAAAASASAVPTPFQATFTDIYSECPISPPSVVFCGPGTIAGYGAAYSTAALTGIAPLPGTDCLKLTAVRTITLDDGNGSLTLDERGTKCPPSAATGNADGDPYTVSKTYVVAGGTGVFAGAAGSGSDINRSGGDSQVSMLSGTLTIG